MFRKVLLIFIGLFITASVSFSQYAKPVSAESILDKAKVESTSSGKNIFLIFHASWCSWCKRLDKAMKSDELKNIFEDNFVIVHLDVMERGTKVDSLENPGGKDVMQKLGGEKSGLPFYVFLDKEEKMLANSNVLNNQNIGYPGAADEIEAFVKLVKTNSKKMSDDEAKLMTDYFIMNAPKPKS